MAADDDVIIDLTEPKPGTLGYRIHRIEDEHEPEPGTLGDRIAAKRRRREKHLVESS